MRLEEFVLKAAEYKVPTFVAKTAVAAGTIGVLPIVIPNQALFDGVKSSARAFEILKTAGGSKVLVVTDAVLMKLGVLSTMLDAMDAAGFPYVIYDGVEPNPSIENIETAYDLYRKGNCDCIVGFGGGSAMDAAKVVGCRVAKPNMSVKQMSRLMGYFPVTLPALAKTPFTLAIPTTAGTGAESTIAAVVSDHSIDAKYTVTDPAMRPNAVILDPSLATGLPGYPTACTAIDAFCHCVEGYIGNGHNARSDEHAERGIRLIIENVDAAITDGSNIEARQALCTAAYMGGQSLNTAATGYVHPFCHKIGAKYGLVHGRCIGAVLPIMLEVYGKKTEKRLAKLSVAVGIGNPKDTKAEQCAQFIKWIRNFNEKYGIEANIPEIKTVDYNEIAESIMVENFLYPTKQIFTREEIFDILDKIRG